MLKDNVSRGAFLRGFLAMGLAGAGTNVAAKPTAAPPSSLEDRLAQLEDDREIVKALNRYSYSIDGRRIADFVDNFTEDGVFDMRPVEWSDDHAKMYLGMFPFGQVHSKGIRLVGRGALTKFMGDGKGTSYRKHMSLDHVITHEENPDIARASSYYMLVRKVGDDIKVASFGHYYDTLRRSPDGRWRIAERIVDMEAGNPSPPKAAG